MSYTTSREHDAIGRIKDAQIECEKAYAAYRKGGSPDRYNECNRRLGAANYELWRVNAGLLDTDR
jgi:hypothetical protein